MAEEAERFGSRMRERRLELKLTQRELAAKLPGKTEGKDISRYERGEHMPGADTRTAIAEVLSITLADLYSGPMAERPEQGPAPDPFANPDADLLREVAAQLASVAATVARIEAQLQGPTRRTPKPAEGSPGK